MSMLSLIIKGQQLGWRRCNHFGGIKVDDELPFLSIAQLKIKRIKIWNYILFNKLKTLFKYAV